MQSCILTFAGWAHSLRYPRPRGKQTRTGTWTFPKPRSRNCWLDVGQSSWVFPHPSRGASGPAVVLARARAGSACESSSGTSFPRRWAPRTMGSCVAPCQLWSGGRGGGDFLKSLSATNQTSSASRRFVSSLFNNEPSSLFITSHRYRNFSLT